MKKPVVSWQSWRGRPDAAPERRGGRALASIWKVLTLVAALAQAAGAAPALAAEAAAPDAAAGGSATAAPAKRAAVLTGIRFWTGPESTRLAIETSEPVTFSTAADSVRRLVKVTLRGAVRAPGEPTSREVRDGAVRWVRIADVPAGLEVTFEVEELTDIPLLSSEVGEDKVPRLYLDVPRPGRAARQAAQEKIAKELSRQHKRIVVIDPGHGGEAAGAVGPKRTLEKEVCLSIALKLAEQLNRLPDVRAFLTRDSDYNVPLRERYRIAERMRADVFVSIHANSGRKRTGRGTEVYFLSLASASDEQAKLLADAENAADMVGGVPAVEEDLVSILVDLKQNEVLHQSAILAEAVLEEITAARKLENRGVKQAPFAVLKSPVVPSILVETAFINNPVEAGLLRSPSFQKEMADQIGRGVMRYLATAPLVARDSADTGKPSGGRR